MGIGYDEMDWREIQGDFWKICKTEKVCERCLGKQCLIGYGKACLANCDLRQETKVQDGMSNIPRADVQGGYDEFETLYAIAHLLALCKACKAGHEPNCLINVCRSVLEVIEFGEEIPFEGTPLQHLMRLSEVDHDKAQMILQEYQNTKDRRNREIRTA